MKNFYSLIRQLCLFVTLLLSSFVSLMPAQATLPYSEGFEGTHNWTLLNGSQTNKWIVSTSTSASGTRSLYITDGSGMTGNANTYSDVSSTVHAYRDIAVPLSVKTIQLSFDWQSEGEYYGATDYDYLQVWLVPSTFMPVPGSKISAGTGRIRLDNRNFLNQGTFTAYNNPNLAVDAFSGSTMRLVLEWTNDGNTQYPPPAAIDNISLKLIPCTAPTSQPTTLTLTAPSATLIDGSFTAASPVPTGYLVLRSTSSTLTAQPVNGTTYSVGNSIGSATVVSAGGTTAFSSTGLSAGTRYYYFVMAYNNTGCAGGPIYNTALPLTADRYTPCAASTGLSTGSVTHNSAVLTWTGTGNHIVEYGPSNYTPGSGASAGTTGTLSSSAAVSPYTVTGLNSNTAYDFYVRRVSCPIAGSFGLNSSKASGTTLPPPCAVPTAKPSNLVLTRTVGQVSGSFTAASPAVSGYLVIRSSAATVTAPSNGVVYSGNALGGTIVSNGSSLSFSDAGLASNTRYYYTVFPYNSEATCTGGPTYLTTGPLQTSTITCPLPPTSPSVSSISAVGATVSWTAAPPGGGGAAINYWVQVSADNFATGSPVNNLLPLSRAITGLIPNTNYQYRIKANNGCDSEWIIGSFITLCGAPAKPTVTLSSTDNTITGTFASANATGFLILKSSTVTPAPGPVNGISYAVGSELNGSTVVSNGTASTFNESGITPNTRYYYHIYAYQTGICSNGPVYSAILSTNIATCPLKPTDPTVTGITAARAIVGWTAAVEDGGAALNFTVQISTDNFATVNTSTGTTLTRTFSNLTANTTYQYRIKATNGCDSEWLTGCFMTTPLAAALTLTSTTTTVSGGFTADAGTRHLIFKSTTATVPKPVLGTTYAVGDVVGVATVISNGLNTTIDESGLTPNTTYYYYIYSYNVGICANGPVYSALLSGNIVTCPPPPTGNTVTAVTPNSAKLNWIKPLGTAAIINYTVEASLNADFTTQIMGSPFIGTAVAQNITGLTANTTYYYRIKANNGCESEWLNGNFCTAPEAPTTLTLTAGTTSIAGSFNSGGSGSGHLVLRSTSATAPVPLPGTIYAIGSNTGPGGVAVLSNSTATTIDDRSLATNTRYYYYIFSYTTGTCANSPVYSAVLRGDIATCPSAPTGNMVTAITQTSATLSWTKPTGNATIGYTVEVSLDPSFSTHIASSPFTVTAPVVSLNLSDLTVGTPYHYRIKANNGCESPWLTGSFVTSCATPEVPFGVTVSLSGGTVNGTISSPSTVPSGYVILRSISATAPVLTNGTTYNTAATVSGNYVVRGSNTVTNAVSFTDVPAAYVYYYVYSFNSGCNGGPVYGGAVSARINACAPTSNGAARYISEVKFLGTLNADTSNITGYTVGGYADYSSMTQKAKQVPGGVINVNINLSGNVTPPTGTIKAWVDWDKDGIFNTIASDTPGGEKVFDTNANSVLAGNVIFGFAVPADTVPGLYTIRMRGSTAGGVTPCGNDADGETEDYTFEVIADCAAKIISVNAAERCGLGSVTLSAVASSGTAGYRWYASEFGTAIPGENSSSYTVPNLAVGKHTYYVTAYEGGCESAYRTPVKISVRPTPEIQFIQSTPDFCGAANTVVISSTGNKEEVTLFEDRFETDNVNSVIFENITEGNNNAAAIWQLRHSPFIPGASYNIVKAALSSGYNGGNFANIITDVRQTTSILNHFSTKTAINTTGITDLKLDFDLYYFSEEDIEAKNYLKLQYSLDNGATWVTHKTYLSDVGVPSRFQSITESLPAALANQTQLKFRFSVYALGSAQANGTVLEWIVDVVGLDNVRLYGNKDLPATFVWSGSGGELLDGTCSSPVAAGGASSVCVRLSEAELESRPQISITASAALSNGCSATGTIVVLNNSKVWNYPSTDWASGNWKPTATVPTAANCVLVKKPVIIGTGTNGLAKNITIMPGGKLNIQGSLKVTDAVVNQRSADFLTVESDAGLIQVNEGNAINTGNITAKRNINVSAGRQQYNYIISPTEGQSLKTIYPGIDYVLYHNEVNNFFYSSSGAYIKGRALAVKEPNAATLPGAAPTQVTATFTGYPTNGAFTYGIVNSNPASPKRGYNLIGNPYPSNMDLMEFYKINGGAAGTLSSSFHLWDNRANSQTVQMGDKYLGQAYAIYNAFDDTGTLAFGDEGLAGTHRPTRYIPMGQGFMVKTSVLNQQLVFNNTVRTEKTGTTTFFGKGAAAMDRYWLNMVTPQNMASNIAVVYFENGNNALGKDDSPSMGGSDEVYSIVENEKIVINGRSPFTNTDAIPLGTRHYTGGQYRLTLAGAEGVFANGQQIYLKDKLTGAVANLSAGDYVFSAAAGESTGRFEIVYKPGGVLSSSAASADGLTVYKDGGNFVVRSVSKKITALQLFDGSGRLLYASEPNAVEAIIDGSSLVNGVYILKIERSGDLVSRKIIK